jgi:hypothetical protein
MKKLFITGVIAALAFSSVAQAELQISGNVTTMVGAQYDSKNTPAAGARYAGGLTQGDLGFTAGPRNNHFGFMVDQAEIDIENEFGENIMARVDIDFFEVGNVGTIRGGNNPVFLEQAYVTANLAIGNGMEFLIGKFNTPLGLEHIDRYENVFSTYTPGWLFLTPRTSLGAKIYYEFNDHWNMDFAVVNGLNNNIANSAYPSGLLRVGAQWGEQGRLSFINGAFAFGPETARNSKFDMHATLWGNWAIGDFWDIGWEGIFRQSSSTVANTNNQRGMAAQLYTVYQPSDSWTVQLRGAYFWDSTVANGSGASTTGTNWGGFRGQTYSGTVGATYQITEGAKMKLEYRLDFASRAAGLANSNHHTGVAEFAYSF